MKKVLLLLFFVLGGSCLLYSFTSVNTAFDYTDITSENEFVTTAEGPGHFVQYQYAKPGFHVKYTKVWDDDPSEESVTSFNQILNQY